MPPTQHAKSFAEVAFLEATARRVPLDLQAIVGARERLSSRFLGATAAGDLVLETPRAGARKVFLPRGTALTLTFRVDRFAIRCDSEVLEHCQFPTRPGRRADGVVVRLPGDASVTDERHAARILLDPGEQLIIASLWPAAALEEGQAPSPRVGELVNYSDAGLGIQLHAALPYDLGQPIVVRLEPRGAEGMRLYRGALRHCTLTQTGHWLAGLSEVVELRPGEAVALLPSLAVPAGGGANGG